MPCDEEEFELLQRILDQKVTEIHVLYNVGKVIGGSLKRSELTEELWLSLKASLSISAMSVYEADPQAQTLRLVYTSSHKLCPIASFQFGEGAPGMAASSARPLHIHDATKFADFLHFPGEKKSARSSVIALPLKTGTDVTGVLVVEQRRGRFTSDDVDLMAMVGLLVSTGLQKSGLYERTEALAQVDGLTGLFNHRTLMERLRQETRRMLRTGRPLSLVMLDIDHFKRVNDTYGHKEGDSVLTDLASVLRSQARESSTDVLGRYGGEEFTLVMADTGLDEALVVAERLRRAVHAYPFHIKSLDARERITISLGVATQSGPNDQDSYLVRCADAALYHSKNTGRDRVSLMKDGELLTLDDIAPHTE
ncbi:MAG: sensor domain-containing diguanylate cyclase [Nitrospirae bacterium]|nr:sensor domain-containing diguanylate cyclase [Nitrospirota bacterium]MBI5695871.1 sensor domain-containing diguanylate cyclase [Nitrospirota bacterium]